jgi:hypothetical protein
MKKGADMFRYKAFLVAATGWAALAQAHPGHGHGHGAKGYSLLHYLSEPEHVAALVLVVVLIGAAFALAWRWHRH